MFGHYFGGQASVDTSALLPEHQDDGYVDFLPIGTKSFYSRHRVSVDVLYSAAATVLAFSLFSCFTVMLHGEDGRETEASKFLFSITSIALIIGLFITLIAYTRSYLKYKQMVKQGSWMEGVFVFQSTGDIVVRFHNIWTIEEQTFPATNITKILLTERKSKILCIKRNFIRITHRYGTFEFDANRLLESPYVVHNYLKETVNHT